jgi:hypothetical protein
MEVENSLSDRPHLIWSIYCLGWRPDELAGLRLQTFDDGEITTHNASMEQFSAFIFGYHESLAPVTSKIHTPPIFQTWTLSQTVSSAALNVRSPTLKSSAHKRVRHSAQR